MPFSIESRTLLNNAATARLTRATVTDFGRIVPPVFDPIIPPRILPFPFPPDPAPPAPAPQPPTPSPIAGDKGTSLISTLTTVHPGDLITSEVMNRLVNALREVGARLDELEAGKNALITVLHETDARLDALEAARSTQPPAPPPTPPPAPPRPPVPDADLLRDFARLAGRLKPLPPDPAHPGDLNFDRAALLELVTFAPRLEAAVQPEVPSATTPGLATGPNIRIPIVP